MTELKFNTDVNPFGIVYNPVSIAQTIERLVQAMPFGADDLFQHNGLWHSFHHHGRFSTESVEKTLGLINERLINSSAYIRNAGFLFLTLGTARIYELKSNGQIVANCHKVPENQFRQFRLTIGETVDYLRKALEKLWDINKALKVVFTVSPIRHWKDGAIENQRSKSTLILAIDALVKGYGPERCGYFPAYEMVMDEMRDYRFYAEDMVHLSPLAISLIWERFSQTMMDTESLQLMTKVEEIIKALHHRPFNKTTPEYQRFIEKTMKKVIDFNNNYPYIDFAVELKKLRDEQENQDVV